MADSKLMNTSTSSSPPPNCAICLGSCSNKCFSDTCMHQFCFSCLLQWSKIKAECPLCKQPFKSIIHNVKSNEEYEEHIVEQPRPVHILDNEQFHLILPHSPPPPSRHHRFHFRTTFTVNTHGENAIQQMLMSHSLTNGITISNYLPHSNHYSPRPRRRARATTTSFRRSIYDSNLWSSMHSDPMSMTVRYRQITPEFFRANPASRGRLVPWLNRELNALLRENTQQVMELVDRIMDYLLRYHICSGPFRNLLRSALGNRTDHFVHEFYNFMRSPFDMVGYDRHVNYYERPTTPTPFIDVSEDDSSDVMIVEESPEIIEVHSSDSDDDVIMTSTFIPKPRLLPDLLLSRRVSVSSSSEEDHQREEERPRKRNIKRARREEERENRQTSRDQDNDSDDEDSSSSVLDDVPLAKYMRIRASIGKKLMKKSGALAKAMSKDLPKKRKHKRSRSKKKNSKKSTSEATSSISSRAHCSKYQPRRRDTSSSSCSSSSSSSSSHNNELRKNKKSRRRSCSSSRSHTPLYPEPSIQMAVNNTVMATPCYDRTLSNRIHGDYASMFRSTSTSPGEGPSGGVSAYVPIAREHSSQSAIDSSIQTPNLEPEVPPQMYGWKEHESLASRREKSRREVMIRYKQHLMGQQNNSHHSLNNAASSSSTASAVYIPHNDKTYQPPMFYNSRSSPDLIDLSVTSRIKHDSPLTVACVPPEIRARYRASPVRSKFYSPCMAEAIENNSRLQNSLLPSTSYAPYNYGGVSNTVFKSEPSYSEYQSEGSTKYWTDLSTHPQTNSNDSAYNYESQQPRKSVIQNSRDNSVPPQNEIISPRWSSSNSPSYPCCPDTWSDNSD